MTMTCRSCSNPCGARLARGPGASLCAAAGPAHPAIARMAAVTNEAMRCMSESPPERTLGRRSSRPRGDRRSRDRCPFVTEAALIVQPRRHSAGGVRRRAGGGVFLELGQEVVEILGADRLELRQGALQQ